MTPTQVQARCTTGRGRGTGANIYSAAPVHVLGLLGGGQGQRGQGQQPSHGVDHIAPRKREKRSGGAGSVDGGRPGAGSDGEGSGTLGQEEVGKLLLINKQNDDAEVCLGGVAGLGWRGGKVHGRLQIVDEISMGQARSSVSGIRTESWGCEGVRAAGNERGPESIHPTPHVRCPLRLRPFAVAVLTLEF